MIEHPGKVNEMRSLVFPRVAVKPAQRHLVDAAYELEAVAACETVFLQQRQHVPSAIVHILPDGREDLFYEHHPPLPEEAGPVRRFSPDTPMLPILPQKRQPPEVTFIQCFSHLPALFERTIRSF
jgi:hypothetical protein